MASIFRKPILVSSNSTRTSRTVMNTDGINGMWKSRFSAIAAPITSAISVAIMASSVIIHNTIPNALPVRARVAWARSIWLTIPSLAAMYCSNIAIKLEIKIVVIRVYWKL